MVVYAQDKKIPCATTAPPKINPVLKYLPFYKIIKSYKHHAEEITKFLNMEKPSSIIATNDRGFYMGYFLEEAGKRGVDTGVLQWALYYPGQQMRPFRGVRFWRRFAYKWFKPIYVGIRDFIVNLVFHGSSRWTKGIIGGGVAKKMGVINELAKKILVKSGVPEKKITVVGYMDFHASRLAKKELDADKKKRAGLFEKYSINPNKKNIIYYSTPFNRKDTAILTDKKQHWLTDTIIKTIRETCEETTHDILFKPHPSEKISAYDWLKQYEVKFMNPLADNNELIALADLYIAGVSTTNFIPLSMNKDAIFVNLAHLPQVESAKEYFGVKKFVETREEFRDLLDKFKNGNLEKQYASGRNIITEDSLNKILAWIEK